MKNGAMRVPGAELGQRLDPLWRFVVRRPGLLICIILLISAAFALFLPRLRIDPSLDSMVVEHSESKVSYRHFLDRFGNDEFVIVAGKPHNGDLFTPEHLRALADLADGFAGLSVIEDVQSLATTPIVVPDAEGITVQPLFETVPTDDEALAQLKKRAIANPLLSGNMVSKDGRSFALFAFPHFGDKGLDTESRLQLYRDTVALCEKNLKDFEWHLEGIPTVKAIMINYIVRGIILFGGLSGLLLCIALYMTFGSMRGVLLPFGVVILALVWTLGLMGAAGDVLDTVSSLLFALVLVVGVGDTIHILVQYFEEYYVLQDKREALLRTMRRMFAPCLLTSVTTAIGFLSLLTIPIPPIRNFGLYASVGVVSAFVISILLAPALLALMSPPTVHYRRRFDEGFMHRNLLRLASFNLGHRTAIVIGALVMLVLAVVGISRIRVETRVAEFFHPWSPIHKGVAFLQENLTPPIPFEVVLRGEPDAFKDPALWRYVDTLHHKFTALPKIDRADSYLDLLKETRWALSPDTVTRGGADAIPQTRQEVAQYSLLLQMDKPEMIDRWISPDFSTMHISLRMADSGSREQLMVLRAMKKILAETKPENISAEVTGGTVIFLTVVEILVDGQVRSLFLALGIITVLIALLFRSIRIGLLSMIPNVLPILMMLGIMGWADFPLDTNTVMIGPITIGIAVDDTIHYVARYRRERAAGSSPTQAMTQTLTSTGRALVSTSMILSIGFVVTILSSFRPQSILGFLGAVTIILALAADLVLLPVVMLRWKNKADRNN